MKKHKGLFAFFAIVAFLVANFAAYNAMNPDHAYGQIKSLAERIVDYDAVTLAETDLITVVDDPAGTPVLGKVTLANLRIALQDGTVVTDLILNSTNEINVQFGGITALAIDDAAISGNAAAADTAGKAAYIETQDGGTDGGDASTGQAGGAFSFKSGDGSAAVTTGAVGGAGGALSATAGDGAAGDTAGNGGAGGSITLTPGEGGASASGTAGANGAVIISDGIFRMQRQTVAMSDAAVQLVLSDAGSGEVELKANILRVDAESSGAGEDLELPPEADCDGMILFIYNPGGENVVVKDDSGGTTIDTVATTEMGVFFCDGTLWSGQNES